MDVLLPAPLGPSSPKHSPLATASVRLRTASLSGLPSCARHHQRTSRTEGMPCLIRLTLTSPRLPQTSSLQCTAGADAWHQMQREGRAWLADLARVDLAQLPDHHGLPVCTGKALHPDPLLMHVRALHLCQFSTHALLAHRCQIWHHARGAPLLPLTTTGQNADVRTLPALEGSGLHCRICALQAQDEQQHLYGDSVCRHATGVCDIARRLSGGASPRCLCRLGQLLLLCG